MREKDLIRCLDSTGNFIQGKELSHRLQLAPSTVRQTISQINRDRLKNGCWISHVPGKGYVLQIDSQEKFQKYIQTSREGIDYHKQSQRLEIILYYLMQAVGYITIEDLCALTSLSRSTLQKDLKEVEDKIKSYDLLLVRKHHYGLKIEGNEKNIRKAFSEYVINSKLYVEPVRAYWDFLQKFDHESLEKHLYWVLKENHLKMSPFAFENIRTHFQVLLYRASQKNYIVSQEDLFAYKIPSDYLNAAKQVGQMIKSHTGMELPENEIGYFARELQSKSEITALSQQEKSRIDKIIRKILKRLDTEFCTDFANDDDLAGNLLLHVYPLINRLKYDFQLKNPLIDDIYLQYNNVFVVALRFSQLLEADLGNCSLSKDEIGFITLHFAACFEKNNQEKLEKIKRIVVVCVTGNSTARLIKTKLESIFQNASIVSVAEVDISQFDNELPDLFLSTIPIGNSYKGIPIIQIKEFLNDEELEKIRSMTALKFSGRDMTESKIVQIKKLFRPQFFQIVGEGNYLDIIRSQAEKMYTLQVASPDFPDLVIERELRYPTIFVNNVASPHPVRLEAIENTVGVTLLPNPIEWQGKLVQIIFLINLKKDSLFIHRELSLLLIKIIENSECRKKLLLAKNFDSFLYEIEKLL